MTSSGRIALGIIRKPHGVRGEASVEPWTEFERFREVASVTLVSPDETQTRTTRIETARAQGDRALIKFAGINTPEELRELQEWTIEIPEKDARKLEKDEYFLHDLVGMQLIDRDGNDRGQVVDAYEGGSGILLNVERKDGKTYEVPFAESICVEIDVKGRRIIVDLPEGIEDAD